jgi:hypothetical protein
MRRFLTLPERKAPVAMGYKKPSTAWNEDPRELLRRLGTLGMFQHILADHAGA